jgi:hypothetical protein
VIVHGKSNVTPIKTGGKYKMKPNPTLKEAAQTATPIRLDEVDAFVIDHMIKKIGALLCFSRCDIVPLRVELQNKFGRFIGFIEGGPEQLYRFIPAPGVIPYTTQS